MDQLFCMRVFVRVVDQGSFARAADDLDIARPTATLALAQLEKRLKLRLLHRTTRRLSLTDEGRVFYQACVRMLDELAEAEELVGTARASPRGLLRASTPNALMHQAFMAELPGFLARCPELTLELVLTDRAVDLVEEGIDCAVRAVGIPDDSTLVARRIHDVYWLTCAAPHYLERHGTPRSFAELARHNCIRFISPSTGRTTDWQFDNGSERSSFTPRGSLGVTSMEGAVAAAVQGIGIAQVSDVLAMPTLRSGALRPLFVESAVPGPPLCVVYPSSRYLTAKVRAFSDFVTEVYPAQGWWEEVKAMAAGTPAITPPTAAPPAPPATRRRSPARRR
jgi:LysR family transcriptional regulator for bpeEF and oprC